MPKAQSAAILSSLLALHRIYANLPKRRPPLGALTSLLVASLLSAGLAAILLWPSGPAQAQDREPTPPSNLQCITRSDVVWFAWDTPEWSGGEASSYDYRLTLPAGQVHQGNIKGKVLLRRGSYPSGEAARLSLKAKYETSDGRTVSSPEAELVCYIGGARPLVITPGNATRVYGGTDNLSYTVSGLVDGDAVGDVVSGSLARDPGDDVGSYAVDLGTLAIAPAYAQKYALPDRLPATTYVITPKPATYTATAADKTYDGTARAPSDLSGGFTAGDIISGDTVTVSGGTYVSPDIGTGIAISGVAADGADAGNYTVTFSVSGDITSRAITAISGVRVNPRLADGTATATFDTSAAQGAGVLARELADFRAGGLVVSGQFPAAAVGSHDLSVTYSLQDHGSFKAGNYALSSSAATATLRGEIQALPEITAISGLKVNARTADGTTAATFDTSRALAVGVLAADLSDFRAGGLVVSGTFPSAEPGAYALGVTYSLQDHGSFKARNYTLYSGAATATLYGILQKAPPEDPLAGCQPAAGDDYDADDDGLIEVCNLAQLSAIRFDLDGDGSASGSTIADAAASYKAAFPGIVANGSGCPLTGCIGYELTADLDCDTNGNGQADAGDAYWNSGDGWLSIGRYAAVFDGNGHSIRNLYFKSHGVRFPARSKRRGLFNDLAETGVIRNVALENVNASGNGDFKGGLVGENYGTISNAGVSGSVSGNRGIGGLVGRNYGGTIRDSYSAGEVSGPGTWVGGLVGQNWVGQNRVGENYVGRPGSIVRSYSTANVTATGPGWHPFAYGGLVGANLERQIGFDSDPMRASIVASYATGRVSGKGAVMGGLVGLNRGEIFASYATGDVSATRSTVGGLVGSNEGPISASFALGAVSGPTKVGGLIGGHTSHTYVDENLHRCIGCSLPNVRPGQTDRSGVTASYWNAQATGQTATHSVHLDSHLDLRPQDTRRTTAELRRPTDYTGIYALWDDLRDNRGDSYAWDFGTSLDFPVLRDTGPSVAAQRAQMPDLPESAEPPANRPEARGIDYDQDDDGLIEVWSLEQLHAIRHDSEGLGWVGDSYYRAYPNPQTEPHMGCPQDGCMGYELMVDLDFDTNGNGRADPGDHYWNGVHLPDDSQRCIDWYGGHPQQEVRVTPGACDDYWGNDGEGWRPMAAMMSHANWYGVFEGNGHAIRNLYINTLDTPFTEEVLNRVSIYTGLPVKPGDGYHNYRGLFENIGYTGVVRNLRLENVSVAGKNAVGALAGTNKGIISNVHVTGEVSGISSVGGLVGSAKPGSFITGSSSRAGVAGRKTGGHDVGGLAGINQGVIQASYARGAVSGWANNTGGLVGSNAGGTIQAGYATGPVSSSGQRAGGLAGSNGGSITASYATGVATVGGGDAGGLVGRQRTGAVTAAYWDTQSSSHGTSPAGAGKTTAELQQPTGYAGIYAGWNLDLNLDGSGDDPWDFGTASQYPVLRYGGPSPAAQREPFAARALDLPQVGTGAQAPPNQAPTVSGSLGDVTVASEGGTREVSLAGLFDDADGDSLTVTASALTITAEPPPGHDGNSYIEVVTVSVAGDYSSLTLTGQVPGTAAVTVTASDGRGGVTGTDFVATVEAGAPQQQQQATENDHTELIAKVYEWRNDSRYVDDKAHTDRWDRVLLTLGEMVADTTLTPMSASEAQGYADRGWTRWVEVAEALRELESAGQQQQSPSNQAPTVSAAIADATIVTESGMLEVSLTGVFSDADSDNLTITADSSNEAIATVSVAADHSTLTVTARARGIATITVTADDGNGGTVEDAFTLTVKAVPVVASTIGDVSGLEVESTQDVSLSGVFGDADGDALTITAASSDDAISTVTVAADQSKLTVAGVAEGTATITVTVQDSDGNQVSDTFDVSVARKYAGLIAQMYQWRNDSRYVDDKAHTDRWDRALLAFGETVADTTLTPMPASEAQGYADRGWTRWAPVAAALLELEGG